MAPLLLTEKDVDGLLRMEDALQAVEDGFRALGRGEATNRPRQRVGASTSTVNVMLASWPARGYSGFKYYSTSSEGIRFWVYLFDGATGEIAAIIQADRLGQRRTGADRRETRELDDAAIRRCAFVATDSIEQAREEGGDLVDPINRGLITWDRVHELCEVVAGKVSGRTNADEITLFKSHGIAMEDVAVAAFVYERARDREIGKSISL